MSKLQKYIFRVLQIYLITQNITILIKLESFLILVDNKESINSLLNAKDITGNITIKIGGENFVECARECSIITAIYRFLEHHLDLLGL